MSFSSMTMRPDLRLSTWVSGGAGRTVFALQPLPLKNPSGNRSKWKTQETTGFSQILVLT